MSDMFETNDLIRTYNSFRQADAAEQAARRLAQMCLCSQSSDSAAIARIERQIDCLFDNIFQLCKRLRAKCIWSCDYCGKKVTIDPNQGASQFECPICQATITIPWI
jgi:rubrerythrin